MPCTMIEVTTTDSVKRGELIGKLAGHAVIDGVHAGSTASRCRECRTSRSASAGRLELRRPEQPQRHRDRADQQQQQRHEPPHGAACHCTDHSKAPMVITTASSPMRSTCWLNPSTACAMYAGACCGSTATASATRLVRVDLGLLDRLLAGLARAFRLLQVAQGHPGREHRQEPIGMQQQRNAIGQRDQPHGQEVVQAHGLLVFAPQVQHQPADGQARAAHPRPGRQRWPKGRPRATSASRTSPISCSPSRPSPSMTNGNAVPSLSPPSPVSAKRRRSRSPGRFTCTSDASTGSVGARIAPSRMQAPTGRPRNSGRGRDAHTVITMEVRASRSGSSQRRSRSAGAELEARGEQRDQHDHLRQPLEQQRMLAAGRPSSGPCPRG